MKAIELKIMKLAAKRATLKADCRERKAITRQINNLKAALHLLDKDRTLAFEVRDGARADKALLKAQVKKLQAHILG